MLYEDLINLRELKHKSENHKTLIYMGYTSLEKS